MKVWSYHHLNRSPRTLLATVALTALLAPMQAFGEEAEDYAIEEIVVTTQKREQSLLDVPISIGVLSSQDIEKLGIQDLEDWGTRVPGFNYVATDPTGITVSVRGISSRALSTVFVAGTTAVYYDDTAMINLPGIPTFDFERIEVIRGPQGTLYGVQALGGLIRYITNKPDSKEFAAQVELTGSTTKHGGENFQGNLMLNIPLVEDKLAVRVVGYYHEKDGFIDNIATFGGATPAENTNFQDTWGGRISIAATLSENLNVMLTALISDTQTGGSNRVGLPDTSVEQPDWINGVRLPEPVSSRYNQYGLNINYDLGFAKFVSTTSFYENERSQFNDINEFIGIFQGFFDPTITFVDGGIRGHAEAFTQELRLMSAGDGPLRWTFGAFYNSSNGIFNQSISLNGNVFNGLFSDNPLEKTTKTKAIFGELYYDLTDDLTLTAGLRYFDQDVDISSESRGVFASPIMEAEVGADDFLYKAALNYNINEDVAAYATVSRGYRAGGADFIDALPQQLLDLPPAVAWEPDFTTNFEIGVKGFFFDRRLSLQTSLFYIDWKNMQVEQGLVFGEFVLDSVIANIGSAHSQGFEVEATLTPAEGFEIFATLSIQESKTDSDVVGPTGIITPKGLTTPSTPDEAFTIGASYSFDISEGLRGSISGDYLYQGDRFGDLENTIVADSYGIGNIRASIAGDDWEAILFVKNVGDKAATITKVFASNWIWRNTPRTIGLTVRKSF